MIRFDISNSSSVEFGGALRTQRIQRCLHLVEGRPCELSQLDVTDAVGNAERRFYAFDRNLVANDVDAHQVGGHGLPTSDGSLWKKQMRQSIIKEALHLGDAAEVLLQLGELAQVLHGTMSCAKGRPMQDWKQRLVLGVTGCGLPNRLI